MLAYHEMTQVSVAMVQVVLSLYWWYIGVNINVNTRYTIWVEKLPFCSENFAVFQLSSHVRKDPSRTVPFTSSRKLSRGLGMRLYVPRALWLPNTLAWGTWSCRCDRDGWRLWDLILSRKHSSFKLLSCTLFTAKVRLRLTVWQNSYTKWQEWVCGGWVEHFTSLSKRGVGALSSASAFNHKRAPM